MSSDPIGTTTPNFSGKVVVVTGGASGVGFGVASAFSAAGADVVIADIDEQAAAEAAARLPGAPGLAVRVDVADRASVERLADISWDRYGHVDVVVNNAGVFPSRLGDLVGASAEDLKWVLEVNVIGTWHGIAVFGERLIRQGTPAHIVNMGSEQSVGLPGPGAGFYTASKSAVLGLTDVLRHEVPEHITVSLACPGTVPSSLLTAARNRPERFGGPVAADEGTPLEYGMPAREVGDRVVAGVAAGDFYIFTHPPVRELVDARHDEMVSAFAKAPRFEGDERLDTRWIAQQLFG